MATCSSYWQTLNIFCLLDTAYRILKKMATKSLKARHEALAESNTQLDILNGGLFADGELPFFKDKIAEIGHFPLTPKKLEDPTDQCRVYVQSGL